MARRKNRWDRAFASCSTEDECTKMEERLLGELEEDLTPGGFLVDPQLYNGLRESIMNACLRRLNQITHGEYSADD